MDIEQTGPVIPYEIIFMILDFIIGHHTFESKEKKIIRTTLSTFLTTKAFERYFRAKMLAISRIFPKVMISQDNDGKFVTCKKCPVDADYRRHGKWVTLKLNIDTEDLHIRVYQDVEKYIDNVCVKKTSITINDSHHKFVCNDDQSDFGISYEWGQTEKSEIYISQGGSMSCDMANDGVIKLFPEFSSSLAQLLLGKYHERIQHNPQDIDFHELKRHVRNTFATHGPMSEN